MNERILELMDQAVQLVADKHTKGDVSRLNTDSYHVEDLINEKFAELIMEEMHDFIMNESAKDNGIPDLGTVKQYFGVKE